MKIKAGRHYLQNKGKFFSCFCLIFFIVLIGVNAEPLTDNYTLISQLPETNYPVKKGKWSKGQANNNKLPNKFGKFNATVQSGKPYLFRLHGFTQAKKVLLTGSFNFWKKDELFMNKTSLGWELLYTLGAGNYEYRFIVDGAEMADPENPKLTNADRYKANSILILEPNYTFRLKEHPNAKIVILSGDFNQFNTNGFVMTKEGDEWIFTLHLSAGKHLYKFIVDGNPIIDPQNKLWEENQSGTDNSVLLIEP